MSGSSSAQPGAPDNDFKWKRQIEWNGRQHTVEIRVGREWRDLKVAVQHQSDPSHDFELEEEIMPLKSEYTIRHDEKTCRLCRTKFPEPRDTEGSEASRPSPNSEQRRKNFEELDRAIRDQIPADEASKLLPIPTGDSTMSPEGESDQLFTVNNAIQLATAGLTERILAGQTIKCQRYWMRSVDLKPPWARHKAKIEMQYTSARKPTGTCKPPTYLETIYHAPGLYDDGETRRTWINNEWHTDIIGQEAAESTNNNPESGDQAAASSS